MNFLDIAPSGGMIGAVVAISFFLLIAGAAYVAFKALKKTAKMAVRMIVVFPDPASPMSSVTPFRDAMP